MPHIRTQIRAALKAMLVGSPDAGDRVLVRRILPLEKHLRPTLLLSFSNERSTDISMDGSQERQLEIRITACAKGDSEVTEDVLDRLSQWVENVFEVDATLGGRLQTYEYQTTQYSFIGEGDQTLCAAALTFMASYYAKPGNN